MKLFCLSSYTNYLLVVKPSSITKLLSTARYNTRIMKSKFDNGSYLVITNSEKIIGS